MDHKRISNLKQLSNYLSSNLNFIQKAISKDYILLNNENWASEEILVQKISIEKKGKKSGYRVVYSVCSHELSNLLKILATKLKTLYTPEECVHGYVTGRHIKSNASTHIGKQHVLSVDIDDFFGNVTLKMITEKMQDYGFQENVAGWIAKITTLNGVLPQGFNTSPIIANMVVDKMDSELFLLCDNSSAYTRYSDDLYFSSDLLLPELDRIEDVITRHGFKLNKSKTKYMRRGQPQYVTGLTVFDKVCPRIPSVIKRNLRLEIYYVNKYGYTNHAIRRLRLRGISKGDDNYREELSKEVDSIRLRLYGWIFYINSIEPILAKRLYSKLCRTKML